MIALSHHLPFVSVGENSNAQIQSEWLDEWLAIDIARGIQQFLQNSYEGTVIEADELLNSIRRTLHRSGAGEIADNIEWIAPPLRISLTDLARKANQSFDWSFIQMLEDKCQEAVKGFADSVEYHGLSSCVETLSKSDSCELSESEIQSKIEAKIDEYRHIGELTKPVFNVSVAH